MLLAAWAREEGYVPLFTLEEKMVSVVWMRDSVRVVGCTAWRSIRREDWSRMMLPFASVITRAVAEVTGIKASSSSSSTAAGSTVGRSRTEVSIGSRCGSSSGPS